MRFSFLALLALAAPAFAGSIDNFGHCTKSNDCKSKQCFEGRCEPSQYWNGHGANGSYCENDSNCSSRNCQRRKCEAKAQKETEPGRSGGGGRRSGGSSEPEEAEQPKIVLDACGKDLRSTVFADDYGDEVVAHDNDRISAALCKRYGADTLAKAKALMAAHYGAGFSDTCREVEGRSDADIACGKKAFDTLPADARDVPFKIPVSCSGTQTKADVERCVKDLGPAKVSGDVAKKLCTTYDADTLAKAKKLVAGGYTGNFATLCRNVDHRTDEELACAKRSLDALFPDDPHGYEFLVPSECDTSLKPR